MKIVFGDDVQLDSFVSRRITRHLRAQQNTTQKEANVLPCL